MISLSGWRETICFRWSVRHVYNHLTLIDTVVSPLQFAYPDNSNFDRLMENENSNTPTCNVTTLALSIIRLAGGDRAKFLHNFCTADIKKMQPDQCCEAFFLNHKGKTLSHGIVISREVDLLIVSTAKSSQALFEHLDKFLLSDDVELTDVSELWRSVFVYGETSEDVLAACEVRVPAEGAVANTGFQVVVRCELAGEGVLILEAAQGDVHVAEALIANGATEVPVESMHDLRVEQKTPWCDSEITDACLTQEFRRDAKAVSYTKGCYLGQETVARLDALGHVNRFLVGFEIVSGEVSVGDVLRKDDKKIGVVTSLAQTADRKNMALGFLRVEFATPEETVECGDVTLLVR